MLININIFSFDSRGSFLLSTGSGFGKNVIIFGAAKSSSMHIDNNRKDILILGKCPIVGLDDTMLTVEKMNSVNFPEQQNKFCLSLHYKWLNIFIFVNSVEIYKLKAKDSEANAAHYV